MKKLTVICALMALMTAFGSTAKGVTWSFDLKTTGDPNSWTSPTVVPTGATQYEYDWLLTKADVYLEGPGIEDGWFDMLPLISEDDKSASGTEPGLPFNVFDPGSPLHIDVLGVTADIIVGVDGLGQGQANIDNITLAEVGGVTATEAWFSMEFTVTPEPMTVLLLGLGSLVLLRKRRSA